MIIIFVILVFFLIQIIVLFCCAAAGNDPVSQYISDEEQMEFIREWMEKKKHKQL